MEPKPNSILPNICVARDILLQAAMIRLGEVDHEINQGYNIIRKYHKTATIFGSARLSDTHPYYEAAYELAYKLAGRGYAVVTGGGHGIMGAANHGALDAGGASIGFNIRLPHEQNLNSWTTESLSFSHFAPRKIVMTLFADAYIYFPGGFGTLDELTEIITLVQTGKTAKAPIILYGSDHWKAFDEFVKNHLAGDLNMISDGDEQIYTITDDIEQIVHMVESNGTYCNHTMTQVISDTNHLATHSLAPQS